MILPIVAYGDPVLRTEGKEISKDHPQLKELIQNMWDTMYNARGVGLAAPQVGQTVRLFLVDTEQVLNQDKEDEEYGKGIKKVFINARILKREGQEWSYEEGCLSIPGIREEVIRNFRLTIQYQDENFNPQTETFDGLNARVIFHEYDHIEGVLFVDHLKALRKRLVKKKLEDITKGNVKVEYKMRFASKKPAIR